MAKLNEQYFSGNQASIFIGDVWLDEIISIDYTLQHSRMPQYGYGSQHFDFLPEGNILITGSFTINFKEPNYLWIILSRYKDFHEGFIERERRKKEEETAANKALTYTGDTRKRAEEFFNTDKADIAKDRLISQNREFDGKSEPELPEQFNHMAFDILMGYGYRLGPESPAETIKSVHIMGKSKIINADGRPVAEQYNFIARKLA